MLLPSFLESSSDTVQPSHTSSYILAIADYFFSIPLYHLLPLLACFDSPSVHCKLLFSLQGQTQILLLYKVPLVP